MNLLNVLSASIIVLTNILVLPTSASIRGNESIYRGGGLTAGHISVKVS
jgi:hypothetical protein